MLSEGVLNPLLDTATLELLLRELSGLEIWIPAIFFKRFVQLHRLPFNASSTVSRQANPKPRCCYETYKKGKPGRERSSDKQTKRKKKRWLLCHCLETSAPLSDLFFKTRLSWMQEGKRYWQSLMNPRSALYFGLVQCDAFVDPRLVMKTCPMLPKCPNPSSNSHLRQSVLGHC